MKKTGLLLMVLFVVVFSASAFSMRTTLKGSFFVPQKSFGVSDTLEFCFSGKDFHVDPYFGAGYSVRYYNEGGSKALIYGPLLRFGASLNFEKTDLTYQLCAGIEGVYANFPTVAFGNVEFGVLYKGYRACLGILFTDSDYSVEVGFGYSWKIK